MPAADIAETLQRALPGVTIESWDASDQPVVVVPAAALVDAVRVLRDTPELNFSFLAEMTAADYWPKEPRFEVVYHVASIGVKDWPRPGMSGAARRLRFKVRVSGDAWRKAWSCGPPLLVSMRSQPCRSTSWRAPSTCSKPST